jgi:hypothetical protein
MHLENEMIADRQQTVDSYAGRQQGEYGVEQGATSGDGRGCHLNMVIELSPVIRVHRKCGRTRNTLGRFRRNTHLICVMTCIA